MEKTLPFDSEKFYKDLLVFTQTQKGKRANFIKTPLTVIDTDQS